MPAVIKDRCCSPYATGMPFRHCIKPTTIGLRPPRKYRLDDVRSQFEHSPDITAVDAMIVYVFARSWNCLPRRIELHLRRKPMHPYTSDTSPEAEEVQLDLF